MSFFNTRRNTVKFKVELELIIPITGNPFRVGLIWETREVNLRTFEIECESEEDVRRFYEEAKEQDLPNVRGYKLRSITSLSAPKEN
jgi:hypothetical protein